jgi:hypothetical protein
MTRHTYLYDMIAMLQARLESVREARALPPGTERNQKRQIAPSMKRVIESQIQERNGRFAGGQTNPADTEVVHLPASLRMWRGLLWLQATDRLVEASESLLVGMLDSRS